METCNNGCGRPRKPKPDGDTYKQCAECIEVCKKSRQKKSAFEQELYRYYQEGKSASASQPVANQGQSTALTHLHQVTSEQTQRVEAKQVDTNTRTNTHIQAADGTVITQTTESTSHSRSLIITETKKFIETYVTALQKHGETLRNGHEIELLKHRIHTSIQAQNDSAFPLKTVKLDIYERAKELTQELLENEYPHVHWSKEELHDRADQLLKQGDKQGYVDIYKDYEKAQDIKKNHTNYEMQREYGEYLNMWLLSGRPLPDDVTITPIKVVKGDMSLLREAYVGDDHEHYAALCDVQQGDCRMSSVPVLCSLLYQIPHASRFLHPLWDKYVEDFRYISDVRKIPGAPRQITATLDFQDALREQPDVGVMQVIDMIDHWDKNYDASMKSIDEVTPNETFLKPDSGIVSVYREWVHKLEHFLKEKQFITPEEQQELLNHSRRADSIATFLRSNRYKNLYKKRTTGVSLRDFELFAGQKHARAEDSSSLVPSSTPPNPFRQNHFNWEDPEVQSCFSMFEHNDTVERELREMQQNS